MAESSHSISMTIVVTTAFALLDALEKGRPGAIQLLDNLVGKVVADAVMAKVLHRPEQTVPTAGETFAA